MCAHLWCLLIQLEDQLLVVKMVESASTAVGSLVSLVQLLDKVKNMVIGDHIQSQVSSRQWLTKQLYCLLGRSKRHSMN